MTAQQIGRNIDISMVYCREHDRYEEMKFRFPVPLLQLEADLMDEESWTSMITHQGKKKLPQKVERSLDCDNGLILDDTRPKSCGCVGIFGVG